MIASCESFQSIRAAVVEIEADEESLELSTTKDPSYKLIPSVDCSLDLSHEVCRVPDCGPHVKAVEPSCGHDNRPPACREARSKLFEQRRDYLVVGAIWQDPPLNHPVMVGGY